jgi:hypothetical protein
MSLYYPGARAVFADIEFNLDFRRFAKGHMRTHVCLSKGAVAGITGNQFA